MRLAVGFGLAGLPASGRASTAFPVASLEVEQADGPRAVARLVDELNVLAESVGAPLTARPGWALAGGAATVTVRPWVLCARDGDGVLAGALVLADEKSGGAVRTTLAGTDGGHRGAVLTSDPGVARLLGAAAGRRLAARSPGTTTVLGPLPAACRVVDAFGDGLAGSTVEPVAGIPVIRSSSELVPDHYLGNGMRRTLRKASNRLAADGRQAVTRFSRDAREQLGLLPDLERMHRARDHVNGRASDLDDVARHRTWRRRFQYLAESGHLELALLHIDGSLAAYALGVPDGSSYRLLEGRFVGSWARYSPGRLVEAATARRALADEAVSTFDWMTSVAPETLLGSNDRDLMVQLVVST